MARARAWVFTWNNPGQEVPSWECRYMAYQKEVGSQGTEHWQGYCYFDVQKTLGSVRKLCPVAHWEIRRGSHEQALAYVTKEDSRVLGGAPVIAGVPPEAGKRTDLDTVAMDLVSGKRKLCDVVAEDPTVYVRYRHGLEALAHRAQRVREWKTLVVVLVGPTGVGKTRWCHERFPRAYVCSKDKWYNGYDSDDVVIMDEFYGQIKYSEMLGLCDRYPMRVETKGGFTNWSPKLLLITSNEEPGTWYKNIAHDWFPPLQRRLDMVIRARVPFMCPMAGCSHENCSRSRSTQFYADMPDGTCLDDDALYALVCSRVVLE